MGTTACRVTPRLKSVNGEVTEIILTAKVPPGATSFMILAFRVPAMRRPFPGVTVPSGQS